MKEASIELVSIIIVTCGVNNYLKSCLDSIRKQTHPSLEVVVIDNSLNQNFSREIVKSYPEIKSYLIEKKNIFYASALNKGIEESKGNFVLCLNDDVTLDKLFIQQALSGFTKDISVGMVSGKVLRSDKITIDSAGLFLTPWRTVQERGYGQEDKQQYKCLEYIFGVNGAVAFYRRKMLESIKINAECFDSDFRMFYEDLDIAWRGHLFGWQGFYVPSAVAYHLRGGTARQIGGIDKPYARRYLCDGLHLDLIKNRYLCMVKNESILGFLLHSPFIFVYDCIVFSYILFFRPSALKSLLQVSGYFKSAFKKRRLINKVRKKQLCKY